MPLMHPVVAVQRTLTINENGPCDFGFRDVGPNKRRCLERHHHNPRPQILERPFVLLQLQQVPAAGESTEVPMKHQQEPMPLVIGEAVYAPFGIGQFERNRRLANLTSSHDWCHASTSRLPLLGINARPRTRVPGAPPARPRDKARATRS